MPISIDQLEGTMKQIKTAFINRYWIIGGVCLLFFLILGIMLAQLNPAQANTVPTSTKSIDPLIQIWQKQIQSDTINNDDRQALETKVGVLIFNATMQARSAEKLPQYRPTIIRSVTVVPPPDDKRFTGIIQSPSVPFSPMSYLIENGWQEKINNEYVTVFAGAGRKDSAQGILIVETENPLRFKFYNTPQKSGSVKIVDFKGFQLVLQAENKDIFYFDVPSQQFIITLGETVPTVTPMPSQKATNEPPIGTLTPTIQAYP